MTSARSKGLNFVREVKKILEYKGYRVEGPGYGVCFYGGGMKPVHKDFFGVFDLLSYRQGKVSGHQVSTLTNKAVKVKALNEAHISGYVWCRAGKNDYRVWWVPADVMETEEEVFVENI
jgi:hypothetical protein